MRCVSQIAGHAPRYLGLSGWHACYREHPGGLTTPAGDCHRKPEPNRPIGTLNWNFTPRSRVSCLAREPWCNSLLSKLRSVGMAVEHGPCLSGC
jgi:hypothetical protein